MASKCDNNFRKASFRVRLFAIDLIAATLIFLCVSSPRCCGSVGGGLDFRTKDTGFKVFGEVRYQYADTGSIATTIVGRTGGRQQDYR
jgi:hypothetical protein